MRLARNSQPKTSYLQNCYEASCSPILQVLTARQKGRLACGLQCPAPDKLALPALGAI